MPDEVQYTTRPAAPRSRARVDDVPHTLVVVPAARITAASVEVRQRAAVASGLPPHVVQRLAGDGHDIIVARERNEAEAKRTLASLEGLQATLLTSATEISRTAALVGLGVLCGALSIVGGATAAGALALVGVLGIAVAAPLRLGGGATEVQRRALHEEHLSAQQALPGDPEAWTALHEVRARTLDPDLPATAAADAWSALDALEAALRGGAEGAHIRQQLAALLSEVDAADPSPPQSTSQAAHKLRAALAAGRDAQEETSRLDAARRASTQRDRS